MQELILPADTGHEGEPLLPLTITVAEAVELGATDTLFYCKFFFPKTCRQAFPDYAQATFDALEDPRQRYVDCEIFRDGAKTTILRLFASKRIAYGISHNIVFTSNSEGHACRSVDWLKRQVDFNTRWAQAFNLRRGGKWSESEAEIIHGTEEFPIRLIAVGITGQVRGINFDDYRPDLIVADDVDNEETAGTEEQRKKSNDLFFGALIQGLASPTDQPDAKAVLLATPQRKGDIIDTCKADPRWKTLTFGCFKEDGTSIWESKFPTQFLKDEKAAYIYRNQLALWMREKECKIISSELSSFRIEWLRTWDKIPDKAWYFIAMDPASSDSKTADDFAMGLFAVLDRHVFLVDCVSERGLMPDMVMAHFWGWRQAHYIRYVVVETVAYQKILAWYMRRQMQQRRIFVPVREFDDRRSKDDRILQNVLDVAPQGNLHYNPAVGHTQKFVQQYVEWYPGAKMHDDALDMVAIGIASLNHANDDLVGEFKRIADEEQELEPIKRSVLCP